MALDGGGVLSIDTAEVFEPLIAPAPYKAAWGGRGSGKSHFFAQLAVMRCVQSTCRILAVREVQNTLSESVKQLIADKIHSLGLSSHFEIIKDQIRHKKNGSLIIFKGMQAYNAHNIKSLEGFDVAWIEEAQSFSQVSLSMLLPTIRKDGSEVWFSWNPRHKADPVDNLFRGVKPPTGAVIVKATWRDNPWFTGRMLQEMRDDFERDPEMATHVWNGDYETVGPSAYYARQIAASEKEGRIGHFPFDPNKPVITSWDLGVDDYTCIWFWQTDGVTANVIDYFESQNIGAQDIVRLSMPEYTADGGLALAQLQELGREKPYTYGKHYLPHDIKVREWGGGAKERAVVLRQLGLENIRKGSAANPEDRIEAVRRILPIVRFHNSSRVIAGVEHLRGYRKNIHKATGLYLGPAKDGHDHAADAFGEFAINCEIYPEIIDKVKTAKDKIDAFLKMPTLDELVSHELGDLDDMADT